MGVDGVCFPELLDDETTPIGVYVDLAGDPATVATHECVLKKGSASVALATAAASGNVTASVTAANLITLGATIGDEITAFWEGTVVDGATTHLWRYPMVLKVEDRLFLWPVLISSLKAELPDIAKACSYPGSQTSWWPQISEALRDVRDMIDQGPSGVKAYAIATPAAVRQLGKWAALETVARVMYRTTGNREKSLADLAGYFHDRFEKVWAGLVLAVKADNASWQTEGATAQAGLQTVHMYGTGAGNGGGGVL